MAITISDTEPRVQYTATSGQTSFAVPFEFFTNADIKVFNGTSQLTFNASPSSASQYSVSGAGVSGGGSITLGGSGATLNDVITIFRDLAIARSTDFPTSGAFQINSLNDELDKIIAMCQQLERDLKFSPRAAATTANTFDITFPNLAANKVLSVNSSGNGLEFAQDITDITTIAGIASDVTTVSGIASNVTTVAGISANVTTVAGAVTNINTVANDIANVNTVATNIADIVTVANDLNEAISEIETAANDLNETTSEIDTVANSIANVDTVGTNIANVNTVAGISTNVTTVAGISSNVTTVAGDSSDIQTVAGISTAVGQVGPIAANVTTVAGISGNVTTVAGISSNVTSVAGIASDVTSVAGIASNVTTVAGDSADIATVAGATTNIGTVATDITNVNTVASNISDVNSFANVYRISATAPTTSLDTGDLYFDTTTDTLKVYGSSGWQNAGSSVNGTAQRYNYTATGGQTTFTGSDNNGNTLTYDAGYIDVYLNGVKLLNGTDVTVTSGSSVVLASGATAGDILDIVAYGTFSVSSLNADNLDSGTVPNARITGAYTGITNLTMSGDLTVDTSTLKVDSTNNRVGVGTASPNNKLHLDIGTDNTGLYINSSDGNTGIALADNGGSIVLQNTGSGDFRVLAGGDLNTPGDNSSEKFRVRANGGITFNGDTSADNALDDYEEGTWTPAAHSGISSLSATEANYVKIGRVVTVYAQCNSFTSKTSSQLKISGLPYTPVTAGRYMQGTCESDGGAVGIARCDATTGRLIFYRPGSTNSSRQNYLGNQLGSGLRFSLTYFVAT